MKIKKFFIFLFLQLHVFFCITGCSNNDSKKESKKPSLEVITIFFRTTFKPFLSICDFIGFFYTFNFFILFFML